MSQQPAVYNVDCETTDYSDLLGEGRVAANYITDIAKEANSPTAHAFSQCTCKRQLYLLKCLIEDLYVQMPKFPQQEKEWEQERLIQLLKRE